MSAAAAAYLAAPDGQEAGRISLEAIARSAGVGIGTLYRHFPTRESLVEAVYGAELDSVIASVDSFADGPADVGLRQWLERYARFFSAKAGLRDVLTAGRASGTIAAPRTRERVRAVIERFLDVGATQGVLRADVDSDDATAALVGILYASASPEQTASLLDLLLDALRPPRNG